MMKKGIVIFIIGCLVFSSFLIVATEETTASQNIIYDYVTFEEPEIKESEIEGYVRVVEKNCDATFDELGNPLLPKKVKTFKLPGFSKNINVEVDLLANADVNTMMFNGVIEPTPKPMPLIRKAGKEDPDFPYSEYIEEAPYYTEEGTYKDDWYAGYHIGTGRNLENGEFITYVNVWFTPIYNVELDGDTTNIDYLTGSAEISITYDEIPGALDEPLEFYDLVIITPSRFISPLQKLVKHKIKYGVDTKLVTLEDIYDEYLEDAYDEPEAIKMFIKDAVEDWGVTHVLLVGGLNSYIYAEDREKYNAGIKDWHLPVRYVSCWAEGMSAPYDSGFSSDLYYACIYDSEWKFDSWDCDEFGVSDGHYAACKVPSGVFGNVNDDEYDLYPEIGVGRISARNIFEVIIVVNKIINYEKPSNKDWYDRMVLIGADSFGGNEGEKACLFMYENYMEQMGFEKIEVFGSNYHGGGLFIDTYGISTALSSGAGYVVFEGHGNPIRWDSHRKGSHKWAGGITAYDFAKLYNGKKLPIVIVGGCHNGQFNITAIPSLFSMDLGLDGYYWTHGLPAPRGFCEWLLMKIGGGAIASTGDTGLGYGAIGGVGYSSQIEAYFFRSIGTDDYVDGGSQTFGSAFNGGLSLYMDKKGQSSSSHIKVIIEWQAHGDPSLKLGGYT